MCTTDYVPSLKEENCTWLRTTESETHKVKDAALEMSWHLLCFSFNSVGFFYILSDKRKSPGTQLYCTLSELRNFYRPKSVKFLRVSALWKVAQNGPQQSRVTQEIIDWTPNYLNTKWKNAEQCYLQNTNVRNVLLSQKHGPSILSIQLALGDAI